MKSRNKKIKEKVVKNKKERKYKIQKVKSVKGCFKNFFRRKKALLGIQEEESRVSKIGFGKAFKKLKMVKFANSERKVNRK